jgi:low temperature requirement protein LtrA
MEQTLLTLAEKHGFTALLVAFFVWWSWLREKRISERLDQVQDAYTQTLRTVVADNTDALRSLKTALENRPCMHMDRK